MNKQAICHQPESPLGFATTPTNFVLRLRVAKNDNFKSIKIIYGMKYLFSAKREEKNMERCYEDQLFAYYEIKLATSDTRLAYIFLLSSTEGEFYYSEDGLTTTYDFNTAFYNHFQLPYTNDIDLIDVPNWVNHTVFYQIFVERFARGQKNKDDGYITIKWGDPVTPKCFAGGDIQGIIDHLDYLYHLGINALYLTPIFLSPSNHKYDIVDYKTIDPMFGDEEVFKTLVKEAHQRGIRIVLDAVFNHCSDKNPWWQDVVKNGKDSPYFDYFIVHGNKVSFNPINYETFSTVRYMPKLNTSNRRLQTELLSIATHYIRKFDIDGWRLDVSDEVSHAFWREFRKAIKEVKSEAIILGENWHGSQSWLQGDQFDGIMNYSYTKAALDYFATERYTAKDMAARLNEILLRYQDPINRMMLNLLDSHDTHRFFTQVQEDKNKMLSAIALTMVFPGMPCIYYGTEIPLPGGYDPDCRRCFPWSQDITNTGFFQKVESLIAIHRDSEVFDYCQYRVESDSNGLLSITRSSPNNEIVYISNETDQPQVITDYKKILIANNFSKDILFPNGFIIGQK
ncbi:MAG TPA: alpha amylase N-terminal ig-like domain-containing protein [Bacilli bacterium]|nr:alpha amylase N-terminal ig-like domain-containing protein [Bacilli bacterium]